MEGPPQGGHSKGELHSSLSAKSDPKRKNRKTGNSNVLCKFLTVSDIRKCSEHMQ